jgi:hypothetical protein
VVQNVGYVDNRLIFVKSKCIVSFQGGNEVSGLASTHRVKWIVYSADNERQYLKAAIEVNHYQY